MKKEAKGVPRTHLCSKAECSLKQAGVLLDHKVPSQSAHPGLLLNYTLITAVRRLP